jgi:valyl-tRNA synthetase
MSKSLGNGIDPLDVVQLYGADALRWTLVAGSSLAADVILDPNDLEATFAPGRNFANKLWNIGRFILSQLPAEVTPRDQIDRAALTLADRWILSRAEATIRDATADLEQFRLDEAAKTCFAFAWGELADWYVEAVKPRLTADDASARIAQAVLTHCFDTVLRLLHPVVPFITEELWQKLPGGERAGDELLIVARWPEPRPAWTDVAAEAAFTAVQQAITAIRNIRAEYRIPPKTRLAATIAPRTADGRHTFEAERDTILRLAQLGELTLNGAAAGEGGAHAVLADGSEVAVALAGAIDVQQECRRLSDERGRLDRQLAGLAVKLANANFVSRAPADVVAREREKEQTWRAQRDVLAGKLSALGCS